MSIQCKTRRKGINKCNVPLAYRKTNYFFPSTSIGLNLQTAYITVRYRTRSNNRPGTYDIFRAL